MTLTASAPALLHVCLDDLHAGKRAQVERLPALRDAASDRELWAVLDGELIRLTVQIGRLEVLGGKAEPAENLWMGGILDDAMRDTRSHQPGRLLDIALIGAMRKAKAAEIVSSETALALARTDDLPAIATALAVNRQEEIAADHSLRERLEQIAGARL